MIDPCFYELRCKGRTSTSATAKNLWQILMRWMVRKEGPRQAYRFGSMQWSAVTWAFRFSTTPKHLCVREADYGHTFSKFSKTWMDTKYPGLSYPLFMWQDIWICISLLECFSCSLVPPRGSAIWNINLRLSLGCMPCQNYKVTWTICKVT